MLLVRVHISGDIPALTALCTTNSGLTYVAATPGNLAAATGVAGILMQDATNGALAPMLVSGTISSAMSSGDYSAVGLTATGGLTRIDAWASDAVGIADEFGNFTYLLATVAAASAGATFPYDVTVWGATGDGVTDDSNAIQNAVRAITVTNQQGGNIIYFPAGNYYCASDIHTIGTQIFRGVSGGNHNGGSRVTFAAGKGLYLDTYGDGTWPFGFANLSADGTVVEDIDINSTVIPGLTIWQPNTVYALGDKVLSPDDCAFYYECTARTGDFKSGLTKPTNGVSLTGWSSAVGDTVVDNHVTWTTRVHSAVVCYARPVIRRFGIYGFTNAGIALLGSFQGAKIGGAYKTTNCDTFSVQTGKISFCGVGIFAIGGDSNSGHVDNVNVTGCGGTSVGFPTGAKGDGFYDLSFLGNSYAYCQVQACTNRPFRFEFGGCAVIRPYAESDNGAPALFSGSHVIVNGTSIGSLDPASTCTIIGSPFGQQIGALDLTGPAPIYATMGIQDGHTAFAFKSSNETDYTRLAYQKDARIDSGWFALTSNASLQNGAAWGVSATGANEGPGWFGFWDGYFTGGNGSKKFYGLTATPETDSQLRRGVRVAGDSFITGTPTPGNYMRRQVITAGYKGGVWAQDTTYPARYADLGQEAYQYEVGGKVYRISSVLGSPTAHGAAPNLAAATTTATAAYGEEYAAAWETALPARDGHVIHPIPRNGHVYKARPIHWTSNTAVFTNRIYSATDTGRNPHFYKPKVPTWQALGGYGQNYLITPTSAAASNVQGRVYKNTAPSVNYTGASEPAWRTDYTPFSDGTITWVQIDLKTNLTGEPAFKQGQLNETTDDPLITSIPPPPDALVWVTLPVQPLSGYPGTTYGVVQPTWATGAGSTTYCDNGLPMLEIGSDANTYVSEGVGKAEWTYVGDVPVYGVTDQLVIEGTLALGSTTALSQLQAAYEVIEANTSGITLTVTSPRSGQILRVYNSSAGNVTVVGVTVGAGKFFTGVYVGGAVNAWKTQGLI